MKCSPSWIFGIGRACMGTLGVGGSQARGFSEVLVSWCCQVQVVWNWIKWETNLKNIGQYCQESPRASSLWSSWSILWRWGTEEKALWKKFLDFDEENVAWWGMNYYEAGWFWLDFVFLLSRAGRYCKKWKFVKLNSSESWVSRHLVMPFVMPFVMPRCLAIIVILRWWSINCMLLSIARC